jgi:hypothetical protein
MDPISGERGKFYYGIKCGTCEKSLPLIETPPKPSPKEADDLRQQIQDKIVRCPFCTQETPVRAPQILVLAAQ